MNVAGPPLQRSKNRSIHEPDNRAHVALRRQLVNRYALVAAFFFMNDVQRESFARIFEHPLRLFRFLENFADLRQRCHFGEDPLTQQ